MQALSVGQTIGRLSWRFLSFQIAPAQCRLLAQRVAWRRRNGLVALRGEADIGCWASRFFSVETDPSRTFGDLEVIPF